MDIYLVGGAVRDRLLNLSVKDRDWVVVGATPEQLLAQGYEPVGADFPVYLHPQSHEEYALARTERRTGSGHKGFECQSHEHVTLEQDLLRRDLTINAMAQDEHGDIIDPYGGLQDLNARVLRHVSPAFSEDPLRVLRVARFAARLSPLGFRIAPETLALMREMCEHGELEHLVAERIWQEVERALASLAPGTFFDVLDQCCGLRHWFQELTPLTGRLAPLNDTAANHDSTSIRWAALLVTLPDTDVATLNARLKAPNEHRQLSQLCQRHMTTLMGAADLSPSAWLSLFDQMDVWRKPYRLEQCLSAISTHLSSSDQSATDTTRKALRLHQAAANISAKTLIDDALLSGKKLRGREVGDALAHARIEAISRALKA